MFTSTDCHWCARVHLEDAHRELVEATRARLAELTQRERALQFTLDSYYLLESQQRFEAQLRKMWVRLHFNDPCEPYLQEAITALNKVGSAFRGVVTDNLYACSIVNKDVPAIVLMAKVRDLKD
jgi:hypothetical protein